MDVVIRWVQEQPAATHIHGLSALIICYLWARVRWLKRSRNYWREEARPGRETHLEVLDMKERVERLTRGVEQLRDVTIEERKP